MIRQDTGNYNVFEVYSGNSSTVTASIQGGGSADFAGNVEVGNFAGNSGSYYFSNGAIYNPLGGTADGEASAFIEMEFQVQISLTVQLIMNCTNCSKHQ